MSEKLKPCPFCGSECYVLELHIQSTHETYFRIKCSKCKINTKFFTTHEAAITDWNTRANEYIPQVLTSEGWKPAKYIEFEPPKWYMRPLTWLLRPLVKILDILDRRK